MSLERSDLFASMNPSGCLNPNCGHPSTEHHFSTDLTSRPCNLCDCTSFEIVTRLNLLVGSTSKLPNILIEPIETESSLKQQIDDLEDALEKSHKEIESLKKKMKQKDAKSEELKYTVGLLRIELQVSENVKRNLRYIIDKNE